MIPGTVGIRSLTPGNISSGFPTSALFQIIHRVKSYALVLQEENFCEIFYHLYVELLEQATPQL